MLYGTDGSPSLGMVKANSSLASFWMQTIQSDSSQIGCRLALCQIIRLSTGPLRSSSLHYWMKNEIRNINSSAMCSLAWDAINSSFEDKESDVCDFNLFSQAAIITGLEQHMIWFLYGMDTGSKICLDLAQWAQFWFTEMAWPCFEMPALISAYLLHSSAFSAERGSRSSIPSHPPIHPSRSRSKPDNAVGAEASITLQAL